VFLAPVLGAAVGCVGTGPLVGGLGERPPVPVKDVAVNWTNHVVFGADPAHGGVQVPALAGFVHLFGPPEIAHGHPVQGDGKITVEVYALPRERPDGPPLERWVLDPETLNRRCWGQDFVGGGYTLFLPWGTYRPDLMQVQLRLCYQPAQGTPVFSDSVITLNSGPEATPVLQSRAEIGPAGRPAAAAAPTPAAAPPVAGTLPAVGMLPFGGAPSAGGLQRVAVNPPVGVGPPMNLAPPSGR
jgi:hypothetical protein